MQNNYCVIMGGGIGSRFWPFSRTENPKQFLDFFGTGRSLLQMTYDRFARFIPPQNIFIVTNETYARKVAEQLPDLDIKQILCEPCRRNTAPCIAYASYHIRAINPKANIVVAPSDHLILKVDEFEAAVRTALTYVSEYPDLVTLGIRPSRPETGYGYIQMAEGRAGEFIRVKTFTEKPDAEMAEVFLSSGEFLWNSGMFVWSVESVTAGFAKHLPDISSQLDTGGEVYGTEQEKRYIEQHFPCCPSISIDYGLMEKADNVLVLPVDFGWADLGTWGSLYELGSKDDRGNVALNSRALFYEASDNLVAMDKPDKLVVLQGLDDCIVAESDNILLICKKAEEQRIKHFVADASLHFNDQYN